MSISTSASNSITVRLKLEHRSGILASVTYAIAEQGGNIGAIDIGWSTSCWKYNSK